MVATRTGSKQLLRDLNRSIVFNLLFSEGPISRAELARKSNLTAPAITQIIGDFVTSGLVIERPADSVTVGRRAVMLEINVGAGYVVGVYAKVQDEALVIVVCNLNCDVVHSTILRHDFPKRVQADPNYQSPPLPVTVQHLRDEGLSQPFINYMSGWKGFVAEEAA